VAEVPVLLLCPFCGGEPSLHTSKGESLWSHEIVGWARVSCPDCDASGGNYCDDGELSAASQATEAWNMREPSALPADQGGEGE